MLQAGQEILPYMLYLPPWVWDETPGRTALAMDSLKNRTQFKYPDHSENSPINMTTTNPSNTSEWQLYRVLQRANLLQYYDVFIAQGGDDVQQLCEAGEEEFLEIMALVGMASKPLHVRRLQKSLQEWVSNPGGFQGPMVPMGGSSSPAPGSISATVREQTFPVHSSSVVTAPTWTPQMPPPSVSPANSNSSSGASPKSDLKDDSALLGMMYQSSGPEGLPVTPKQSTSPVPTPVLVESQIQAIADAAERLAKELPPFEPKGLNTKKTINREIQAVVNMTEDDPCRMDELRKYAAIYGRFDSKRKNHKPMSLHEISVNEASAQLCKHIPALLTRREDLFPLARQVVRDSGYQYSKGHSRGSNEPPSIKKMKMDPVFLRLYDNSQKTVKAEMDKLHREERMSAVQSELEQISTARDELKSRVQIAKDSQDYNLVHNVQAELENLMSRQVQLLSEQNDMAVKQQKYEKYIQIISKGTGSCYGDDDFDSSNLPSGSSSPHNSSHDADDFDATKTNIFPGVLRRHNPKAKQVVKETLFDEGLRIAQQYGMADFAEELKGLQQGIEVDDDEDDTIDVENTEFKRITEMKGKATTDKNGSDEMECSTGRKTDNGSDRTSPGLNSRADQAENNGSCIADRISVPDKTTTGLVRIENEQHQANRQTNAQVTLITNGTSHTESSPSNTEHSNMVEDDRLQYMASDSSVPYRSIEGLPAYAAKSFVQKEVTYSQ